MPIILRIQKDVQYTLVGRIHFDRHAEHFTCDRIMSDRLYKSDDMLFNGDFVDISPANDLDQSDFTVQLLVYHRVSECNVCIFSFVDIGLALIAIPSQTTTRGVEAIKADREKHKRYEIDGTDWSETEDTHDPLISKPGSQFPLTPDVETTRHILSSQQFQCEGCGKSGDGYETSGKTIQCCSCNKRSHEKCIKNQLELTLPQMDGTWNCPSCRGLAVWTDDK